MPSLMILIPLFGIIALNLIFAGSVKMRRWAFVFALALFVLQIAVAVFYHPAFRNNSLERIDSFFRMAFFIDHLTFIMFICIGLVSIASLFVARYTMPDESGRFKFTNLLILASLGMSGIVMVKDIFSLYVFMEITAVASFLLIAYPKTIESLEGSFKYLILSSVATVLMLSSIGLLLLVSGSTSFTEIAAGIDGSRGSAFVLLAIGLFICGLFIKGGLVPFHGWLPDAYMAAPAPVSILLAGIVTKAAGIYTMIRIVTTLFPYNQAVNSVIMLIGTISIFVGAIAAIGQDNFKRMLAYSSISQVGYIILGLGAGTGLGIAGAVFHLFNHSVFKSLLFVNSAVVEKETGTCSMNEMGGISQKMPVTGTTSVIAFLSTCGMPPLSGFWSKLIIVVALWQAGHHVYSALAVIASVITLAYFLSMQRRVFFGKLKAGLENIKDADRGVLGVSIILAAVIVGVGVFFPFVYTTLISPVKEILIR
ncbi:MAG: proton-conducting transporter membrane subunit [Candidatus Omnitrophica bacterium]|nr:proton-conducting transporter membrane subunit [Candidatus Omnitrophota bacterium]